MCGLLLFCSFVVLVPVTQNPVGIYAGFCLLYTTLHFNHWPRYSHCAVCKTIWRKQFYRVIHICNQASPSDWKVWSIAFVCGLLASSNDISRNSETRTTEKLCTQKLIAYHNSDSTYLHFLKELDVFAHTYNDDLNLTSFLSHICLWFPISKNNEWQRGRERDN